MDEAKRNDQTQKSQEAIFLLRKHLPSLRTWWDGNMTRRIEIGGSKVLLTGATGGIGHAIARALAGRGAHLTLTGRRTNVLDPLAAELTGTAVAADLAVPEDVERLASDCAGADILVANAGLSAAGNVLDLTSANLDTVITVNLRAPMVLARLLAEQMKSRGRGHIVFVGSLSGLVSSPGSAVYSATKFGLRGYSLGLREDLHGTGVGVSIVEPGFIRDAGMFADAGTPNPRGTRTSSPEEVAAGVIKAIEGNRPEVLVAPMEMRAGARLGMTLPRFAGFVQRHSGADEVTAALSAVHRQKL
jgi:short-subunit dehydrogenase